MLAGFVRRIIWESSIWLMLLALSLPIDKASLTVALNAPAGMPSPSHARPMASMPYHVGSERHNWTMPNAPLNDTGRVSSPTLPTALLTLIWLTLPLGYILSSCLPEAWSAPKVRFISPLEKPPLLFA